MSAGDLSELVVLAALAGAPAGLAPDELFSVLESAGADPDAALRSAEMLLGRGDVYAEGERFYLASSGAAALLKAYGELEAALDPSPTTPGMEECPSIPWLTQVQTAWIDAVSFNYAVDPAVLAAVLPAPLEPELHKGSAWVQVLISSLREMRPQGLPGLFGVNFHQVSYRAAVHYKGGDGKYRRGGYFVRSETDHLVMRAVGNALVEFRFHEFGAAKIANVRKGNELHVTVHPDEGSHPGGRLDAVLDLTPQARIAGSTWESTGELQRALVECYDAFGVDRVAQSDGGGAYVYVLTIDREPWQPVFVKPKGPVRCEWIERAPFAGHARLDSVLYLPKPCAYRWRPLRRERVR